MCTIIQINYTVILTFIYLLRYYYLTIYNIILIIIYIIPVGVGLFKLTYLVHQSCLRESAGTRVGRINIWFVHC